MNGQTLYSDRLAATGLAQKAAVAEAVGPTRLRQIIMEATAAAGTLVLRDGAGGEIKMGQIATPASAGSTYTIDIPGDGLAFKTGIHATISACAAVFGYG